LFVAASVILFQLITAHSSTLSAQKSEKERRLLSLVQSLPANSWEKALAWRQLGELVESDGRLEEASQYYQNCLQIARRLPGDRGRLLAATTGILLGRVNRNLGQLEKARELYEEVLGSLQAYFDRRLSEDSQTWSEEETALLVTYTTLLVDVVDFYRDVEQLLSAEKHLLRLKHLVSEIGQKQPRQLRRQILPAETMAYYFEAELERIQQRYDKARGLFEDALARAQRAQEELENAGLPEVAAELRPVQLSTLVGLALTCYALGQIGQEDPQLAYQKSEQYYLQVIKSLEKRGGGRPSHELARCQTNLGVLYHEWAKLTSPPDEKLLRKAASLLEDAVKRYSDQPAPPQEWVHAAQSLGLLLLDMGQPERALQLAQKGSELLGQLPVSVQNLQLRRNNAMLLARATWAAAGSDATRRRQAIRYGQEAAQYVQQSLLQMLGDPFGRGTTRQRLWGRMEGTLLGWYLELIRQGEPVSELELLEILERARAQALVEEMQLASGTLFQAIPAEERDKVQQKWEQTQIRLAELAAQIAITRDGRERERLLGEHTELSRQYDELVRQIWTSGRSAEYVETLWPSEDLSKQLPAVLQWIKSQRLLVLYYLTDWDASYLLVLGGGETSRSPLLMELTLSNQQGEVLARYCGLSPRDLHRSGKLPLKLLRTILDPEKGVMALLAKKDQEDLEVVLLELGKILIPEPIGERIADHTSYETLVIVADGPLGMFPFQCLRVPRGPVEMYLIELARPVVYVPSLLLGRRLQGRKLDPPRRAVCIGKHRFTEYTEYQVRDLPEIARESSTVARRLQDAGLEVETFFDWLPGTPEPTKEAVIARLSGAAIIHLGTHGVGGKQFGQWGGCLLLSSPKQSAGREGLLTLPEIGRLPLRSAHVVLLSACHTQQGLEIEGEGIWGVGRGFLVAGVRQTVATLWAVDSEATNEVMALLTARIAENLKRSQSSDQTANPDLLQVAGALREAQLALIQEARQGQSPTRRNWDRPFYWAPFVVIGAP
jgi:CHAT domain-containing protein/tetratricopeptide (TPR) repeat protein